MGREWSAAGRSLGGRRPVDGGRGRQPRFQDVPPQTEEGIVRGRFEFGIREGRSARMPEIVDHHHRHGRYVQGPELSEWRHGGLHLSGSNRQRAERDLQFARRVQEQVGRSRSVKHRPAGVGRVGLGRGRLRIDHLRARRG